MPSLQNPRHERFAQERARGRTLAVAWERAGGKRDHRHPSRLSRRPEIIQRIEEIKFDAADRATGALAIDKQWVMQRLVDNVERAMEPKRVLRGGVPTGTYYFNGATAIRALELLGKELGMFANHREPDAPRFTISDEPITAEEWLARQGRG